MVSVDPRVLFEGVQEACYVIKDSMSGNFRHAKYLPVSRTALITLIIFVMSYNMHLMKALAANYYRELSI